MELRVLKYFAVVAAENSITKAAEKLYITQPTLSRQIAELEEEVGAPLLVRGNRSVSLTAAGELLLRRAEEMIALEDKIKEEVGSGSPGGVISLGLAVLHPVYYRHIVREGLPKFVRFAKNVWEIPAEGKTDVQLALAGIDALAAFIKECGLPSHLTELKMKDSPEKLLTDRALEEIAYSTTILPGSYKRMTGSEIYEIFKECM